MSENKYVVSITTGEDLYDIEPIQTTVGVYSSFKKARKAIKEDLHKNHSNRQLRHTQESVTGMWQGFSRNGCPADAVLISENASMFLAGLDMYLIEEFIEDAELN